MYYFLFSFIVPKIINKNIVIDKVRLVLLDFCEVHISGISSQLGGYGRWNKYSYFKLVMSKFCYSEIIHSLLSHVTVYTKQNLSLMEQFTFFYR